MRRHCALLPVPSRVSLRSRFSLVSLLALAACTTSPTLSRFPPANSPAGVEATFQVGTRRIRGELLEVSDSGFVVRQSPEIVFVPMTVIRGARFRGVGPTATPTPTREQLEMLRLVSRFPAGIPPGVLPQLLAQTGQSRVVVVTP